MWFDRPRPIDIRYTDRDPFNRQDNPADGATGVDACRRPAARRPHAARVHRHLRQRHDAARHDGAARSGCRGTARRCRWPASTTRCGSIVRSAPTTGCSTTRRRCRPAPGVVWPAGRSSPATAGWPSPLCRKVWRESGPMMNASFGFVRASSAVSALSPAACSSDSPRRPGRLRRRIGLRGDRPRPQRSQPTPAALRPAPRRRTTSRPGARRRHRRQPPHPLGDPTVEPHRDRSSSAARRPRRVRADRRHVVRRRAGRKGRDHATTVSAGADALDITELPTPRASAACWASPSRPTAAWPTSTTPTTTATRGIDEYAVSADGTFDPATRREVLGFDQPYPNHNGGDVVFGPDGMLYIGTGDGGQAATPTGERSTWASGSARSCASTRTPSADAAYTVPADNPFVGVDGARPEIWSFGLRNPWRFSFDRSTGDLWIADVGQGQWEEVDVGWAADGGGRRAQLRMERVRGQPPVQRRPIRRRRHTADPRVRARRPGCSISGSALYRGAAIPALVGWYVFADYCSGQVRALQIADRAEVKQVGARQGDRVSLRSTKGPMASCTWCRAEARSIAVTPA